MRFCGISGLGWDCLFGTGLDGAAGCYIIVIAFLLDLFCAWACWEGRCEVDIESLFEVVYGLVILGWEGRIGLGGGQRRQRQCSEHGM